MIYSLQAEKCVFVYKVKGLILKVGGSCLSKLRTKEVDEKGGVCLSRKLFDQIEGYKEKSSEENQEVSM